MTDYKVVAATAITWRVPECSLWGFQGGGGGGGGDGGDGGDVGIFVVVVVVVVYSSVVYGLRYSEICYRPSRSAMLPQDGDGHFSEYLKADMFSSQQVGAANGNGLHF